MCEIASQAKKNITYYKNYVVRTLFVILISVSFNTPSVYAQGWRPIIPIFETPNAVKGMNGIFLDENNGWLTSNWPDSGRVWQTTNGGRNWIARRKGELAYLRIIKFFGPRVGIIKVETFKKPRKHYLLKTNNGGNTWQKITVPNFSAITFLDTLNGFAGGENAIYQTTDGGVSWLASKTDITIGFYIWNFFFVDENYGWASGINLNVTDTGILLNTTDGGKTWHIQIERTHWIHGIYFIDMLNGAIVGDNMKMDGKIQMTHDGGMSWTKKHLLSPTLYDVEFIDKHRGWALGLYGFIWKTKDGGDTWEEVESGTEENLGNICFVENGTVGYIFGFNKTLLKYNSKVSNGDGSSNVSVSPNYPNPFINKTTFTYDLWEDDQIEISVFDITGRLVDKLFSGYQEKGIYPVTWHPKNISSGIYFFKIKTSKSLNIVRCLCVK